MKYWNNVTSSAVFLFVFVFVVVEEQVKNMSVAEGSMPQYDVSWALIYTTYTNIWSPLDSSELTGGVWDSFPLSMTLV